LRALNGVSLSVGRGEIVAVIGANGAGKSTLLNAISGCVKASRGSIVFGSERIDNREERQIVQLGICQVAEGRRLFPDLSVIDNLRLGAYSRFFKNWNLVSGWLASRRLRGETAADIDRVFSIFPRLSERRRQRTGSMSGGEQQMVAIGRSLMARPRVLMLDEPSMGLAPKMVKEVIELVGTLRSLGLTILLVEQNANQALQIADRAYVLKEGTVAMEGVASALANDDAIRNAYLGRPDSKRM
jgi:branched-chain amino acid transport system ATP-binding protein